MSSTGDKNCLSRNCCREKENSSYRTRTTEFGQSRETLGDVLNLRSCGATLTRGGSVHMRHVPGTAVMSAKGNAIAYAVPDLPRGA